ncbi:MAG: carotenoid cleavage dioxygenase-like enzyme [Candidatus Azotimanducaceae bacterium]|jgi:carotenoid cleavage dioxygenase-like enzyme
MSVAETREFDNQHLQGNNKPVYEKVTAENLEVIGEIPTDIAGHFLRVGPNPYFVPDESKYHIFDGDGMIHGVHIKAGQATYRNRFIDSAGLKEERETGHWKYPGMNMYGAYIAKGEMPDVKNTDNTDMVHH